MWGNNRDPLIPVLKKLQESSEQARGTPKLIQEEREKQVQSNYKPKQVRRATGRFIKDAFLDMAQE